MHMDLGLLDPFSGKHRVPQSKIFFEKEGRFFSRFFSFCNLGNRIFIRKDFLGPKTLKKCFLLVTPVVTLQ